MTSSCFLCLFVRVAFIQSSTTLISLHGKIQLTEKSNAQYSGVVSLIPQQPEAFAAARAGIGSGFTSWECRLLPEGQHPTLL